jgi:DNA processing protein
MAKILGGAERVAWLRLARTPRIGPLTFHRLIARHGGAPAALENLGRLSRAAPLAPPSVSEAEDELARLETLGAALYCSCETTYPAPLAHLETPPPVLAVRGRMEWLARPALAIVGAREASAAGLRMAQMLAGDLGAAGFVIVSGLARGVDGAAHAAALRTGTVAVLAGGLDKPYPPQNLKLHEEIAAKGAVVSEAPIGAVARARDFPRRNHIISGLSLGVVVIEAAERSGSLITARAAAEQNREVFAVPGSPLDPRARGSNALIKEGAALIETAGDVIAALEAAPMQLKRAPRQTALFEPEDSYAPAPEPAAPLDQVTAGLARLLSPTPIHLNELARLLGVGVSQAAAALTELEIEGRAASLPGGYAATAQAAFSRGSDV